MSYLGQTQNPGWGYPVLWGVYAKTTMQPLGDNYWFNWWGVVEQGAKARPYVDHL